MRMGRLLPLLLALPASAICLSTCAAQVKRLPDLRINSFIQPKTPFFDSDELPAHATSMLGTSKLRVGDYLRTAILTADGKQVVTASSNKIFRFNALTGKRIRQLNSGYVNYRELAISPDGKQLAMTQYSNSVQLWDADTGKVVKSLSTVNRSHRLMDVTFSRDGKRLAACPEDYYSSKANADPRGAYVWDVATGQQFGPLLLMHQRQVRCALTKDGNILATFGYPSYGNSAALRTASQTVQLWDVDKSKEIGKLEGNRGNVIAGAFSPDGKFFAAVSGRSTVNLWDVTKSKLLKRFAGRASSSSTGAFAEFSPNGNYLVVGNASGMVQLWETKTWKRRDVNGPRCRATSVAFAKDGTVIACGIEGQAVRLWNVKTGQPLIEQTGHSHYIKDIVFTPNDKEVLSVDQSGKMCWWDRATGKELRSAYLQELDGTQNPGNYQYYMLAVSSDTNHIAAQHNGSVRLWHLPSKRIVCDFEGGYNSSQNTMGFSPKSKKLAVMNSDASVSVWDIATGEELRQFNVNKDKQQVNISSAQVAFSPNGDRIAASCYYYNNRSHYVACMWDLATGKELLRVNLPSGLPVLAFSPDGSLLAVGGNTGVAVYNPKNGKELRRFSGGGSNLSCLAFSPDGRTLAAATLTYSSSTSLPEVYSWEVATGRIRCKYTGHIGPIQTLTFSRDGKTLATGSHDTSIILWDLSGRDFKTPKQTGKIVPQVLWENLTNTDGEFAFRSMGQLVVIPQATVELMKRNLKPIQGIKLDDNGIRNLIVNLDHPSFYARERATIMLKKVGRRARPLLIKAIARADSTEMKQRIGALIDRLELGIVTTKALRELRAVEVLERIGTAESRVLLAQLAGGSPGAPLTEHARAALSRLKK